jgi:hypothetical protein
MAERLEHGRIQDRKSADRGKHRGIEGLRPAFNDLQKTAAQPPQQSTVNCSPAQIPISYPTGSAQSKIDTCSIHHARKCLSPDELRRCPVPETRPWISLATELLYKC